jgi:hypothetical protein
MSRTDWCPPTHDRNAHISGCDKFLYGPQGRTFRCAGPGGLDVNREKMRVARQKRRAARVPRQGGPGQDGATP